MMWSRQSSRPLCTLKGRACLIVSAVTVSKAREPLVECVVCYQGSGGDAPTIEGGITDIVHIRMSFRSLVAVVVNTRVWADVEMCSHGPRTIAPLHPDFGPDESRLDRTLWEIGTDVRCAGVDVELPDGQRVDIREVQLHEHPRPRLSRRCGRAQ